MKTLKKKLNIIAILVKNAISNKKAEGFVDSGVKILIAIVIGTLILSTLYFLMGAIVLQEMQMRIIDIINYIG